MLGSIISLAVSGAGVTGNLAPAARAIGTAAAIAARNIANLFVDKPLFYPLDIGNESSFITNSVNFNRPVIVFSSKNTNPNDDHSSVSIVFPIPQGLEFSDGASYDDTSLGLAGAVFAAGAAAIGGDQGQRATAVMESLNKAGQGSIDMIKQTASNATLASGLAVSVSALGLVPDKVAAAVGIGMKMTMNRHVVTEFTGVGTRAYGFKFKMVASSKDESDRILAICDAFREGLYPDGNELSVNYPPAWNIRFMLGSADIGYIPKIWECYLTNVNVSYNGSGNLWHTDGSPLECDITISFKETRNLVFNDIKNLKTAAYANIPNPNKVTIPVKQDAPGAATQSNNTSAKNTNTAPVRQA